MNDVQIRLLKSLNATADSLRALRDEIRAIRNEYERLNQDREPPSPPSVIHAELQIPERIERGNQSNADREHRTQVWLTVGTWLAFLAAALYAGIAARQKATMDATLSQIRQQVTFAQEANKLARQSIDSAILAERPWIGIVFGIRDWTTGRNASAVVTFTNSGRRPAKVTRARFDNHEYVTFPQNPEYRRNPTEVNSSALMVPNGFVTNSQPLGVVTDQRLDDLRRTHRTFYIYAAVDYEDVLTHAAHWTHACMQYLPGFENTASGFVNCPAYNDTDEEQVTPKK